MKLLNQKCNYFAKIILKCTTVLFFSDTCTGTCIKCPLENWGIFRVYRDVFQLDSQLVNVARYGSLNLLFDIYFLPSCKMYTNPD